MDEIMIYETEMAVAQAKSLVDSIEYHSKYNLYGESVGAIFVAVSGFIKTAITTILKIIIGSKAAIVFALGYIVFKVLKKAAQGILTDI